MTLSAIVGEHVNLHREDDYTPGLYKALCPFHKERTPSFTLNDITGRFHCFGCGVDGDGAAFMRLLEARGKA